MLVVDKVRSISGALYRLLSSLFRWIYTQVRLRYFVQSIITLGLFGLVPGAWLIALPVFGFYAAARIYLYRKLNPLEFRAIFGNFAPTMRAYIFNFRRTVNLRNAVDYCVDNPWAVAKFMTAFTILFTWSMPFSFFSIYGMYRLSSAEWRTAFKNRASDLYDNAVTIMQSMDRQLNFTTKAALFGGVASIIVGTSYFLGSGIALLGLSEIPIIALEVCVTAVGVTAIVRDVGEMLTRPIQHFMRHPGKFYGLVWGRWLAFEFLRGQVVGSVGPATGHVDQNGLLSSIFGFLFPTNGGLFAFGTGLTGLITTRFMAFVNGIVSSVFFSYNMRLAGDFYGVIGPTSFQIFLAMGLGCFLGHLMERAAFSICEAVLHDADVIHNTSPVQNGITRLNRIADWLYHQRWNIAFIASMTPVVLAAPGSGAIYAIAYENTILAAALTATTGLFAMTLFDRLFNAVRNNLRSNLHNNAHATAEPANSAQKPRTRKISPTKQGSLPKKAPTVLHAAPQRPRRGRAAANHDVVPTTTPRRSPRLQRTSP